MKLNKKNWPKNIVYHDYEIYFSKHGLDYPLPLKFNIENYYSAGVIRKKELINKAFYIGVCRNACIAKWDADKNVFWYLRTKFKNTFFESINHVANDDGYDLFIPMELYKK